MSNTLYEYATVEDRKTLLGVMYAKGAIFHRASDKLTLDQAGERFVRGYPYVRINNRPHDGGFSISGVSSNLNNVKVLKWPSQAAEVLEDLDKIFNAKQPIVIDNVGDYKATISDKGIQVGCQTISFAKFQEIVNGIEQFKK